MVCDAGIDDSGGASGDTGEYMCRLVSVGLRECIVLSGDPVVSVGVVVAGEDVC